MKREVFVVTAAYGRQQIEALGGQQALLPIVAAAGADGVEIRRELFSKAQLRALPALGSAIAVTRLSAFYSVPEALFMPDGTLNPRLDQHFAEAGQLNAQLIKYSLGHYQPQQDCQALHAFLARQTVHLVVENDQTHCGRLAGLAAFFRECGDARIHCGMTFDTGNWWWAGESPLTAAQSLARYVSYIHIKAVVADGDSWRAIPPDNDPLWRDTLAMLPAEVPRAIEFPLEGRDLAEVTRRYVNLLREA